MIIETSPGYQYSEVLLVPQYSEIKHRSEVDLSSRLFRLGSSFGPIKIPVIAANMSTIASSDMIIEMERNGGLCILHRYASIEDTIKLIAELKSYDINKIIPSVGIGSEQVEVFEQYANLGIEAVCIDIAHGDSKQMLDTIRLLKIVNPRFKIIAGNVATPEAAHRLWNEGADAIKIGIGNSPVCRTQHNTGVGYPQFSSILNIAKSFPNDKPRPTLIADGGIKEIGDITKALGAGADFVMSGSLFSRCTETNSEYYSGMASKKAQESFKGWSKNIEGMSIEIEHTTCVKDLMTTIKEGLQSGFSYCGARNIEELHAKATFVVRK